MKRLLQEIILSKISYLVEKLEKRNINEKLKVFKKLEKYKISKKIGLYLIENSTRDFGVEDDFGGINSSLIELCFKNYYDEYNSAIEKIFEDLSEKAQDRVLYLLTTRNEKNSLSLYSDLVLKYYKNRKNIPIGELPNKPLAYPYLFPKLFKTFNFDIDKNNILIILSTYLNAGVVLKDDLKKNKKVVTEYLSKLFEKSLKFKFKNTYNGLHNLEYKDLRYFLELAVNIEYYLDSKKLKSYFTKLLKKNDNQLKLFILDNYLRSGKDVSKFDFETIAKDKASRYALFELLTIYEKLEYMPKKYYNQKSLAESDFYTNFVITTYYTSEPKNIRYYDKITKNGYDYYIFKYKYNYQYNLSSNDYLTSYICNQLGIDKYNGQNIEGLFIGIAGGYDKGISMIKKNHQNLLINKITDDDDILQVADKLLDESEIIINKEEEKTKKIIFKKKQKKEEVKSKKERKKLFNFRKKEKKEKIVKEEVSIDPTTQKKLRHNIFAYILLFLFAVFIGLLIYCILYIYGVASINDGIDQEIIQPTKLNDKGNFTEIMGSEIFNQTEPEYFVLLFSSAKKDKTKYYRYINEYNKRNYRFYYVDLKNNENKFLYGPNNLGFTLYTDRFLKVKDHEYEYYVDGKKYILNEMQQQIEEIIQKEKEEKQAMLKEKRKEELISMILNMSDENIENNDSLQLSKLLNEIDKKRGNRITYKLKKENKLDFSFDVEQIQTIGNIKFAKNDEYIKKDITIIESNKEDKKVLQTSANEDDKQYQLKTPKKLILK